MKKFVSSILFLVLCFLLTACNINDTKYEKSDDGETTALVYQNKKYYYTDLFYVTEQLTVPCEGDIKIGENHYADYYSYASEEPIYIYGKPKSISLHFCEDYDYNTDIFVIDGTYIEIVFSDIFAESDYIERDTFKKYDQEISIKLSSKLYPKLYTKMKVFLKNDVWYIAFNNKVYNISNRFLSLLIENEIISN